MNAKSKLFTCILVSLKERSPYFTHQTIHAAINEAELGLKDEAINVYLHQAVKQGIIHDAGRGWYSRLSQPVKLDLQPVAKLVKAVEKAFPLLEFTVWSTAQLNPWMHHLLAQPVTFLSAPRDTLESVGDKLKDLGWEVAVNPGRKAAAKAIRPGEKMVVLRPAHSKQPPAKAGHQMSVEQVVVELLIEAADCGLMDESEAREAVRGLVLAGLTQIPAMQRFAGFRRVELTVIDELTKATIS
jgi:hypothetical protein